jgi:ribokinase
MLDDVDEHPYDVVVVGSANRDLAIRVERAPRAGETVPGGDPVEGPGGKGLNQAVACARLGLRTAFVGCVGDDEAGRGLRRTLDDEGVTPLLATTPGPTGQTVVLTDAGGDSTIVASPGANAAVDADAVDVHRDLLADARAVLVQHEIGEAAVAAAARGTKGWFVLNPAPGRVVADEVLARVDVLVPNGHELAVLAGRDDVPDKAGAAAAVARRLGLRGTVVVTLGEHGCVVVEADGTTTVVPAERVTVVDATAAGDTFCAALVTGLLDGLPVVDAARWATRAAALTVTRAGAAGSVPRRAELG